MAYRYYHDDAWKQHVCTYLYMVIYILFQINEKHCVDSGMLLL